jgi:hypothetical protein
VASIPITLTMTVTLFACAPLDGPEMDGPELDGPELDGPELDGPELIVELSVTLPMVPLNFHVTVVLGSVVPMITPTPVVSYGIVKL